MDPEKTPRVVVAFPIGSDVGGQYENMYALPSGGAIFVLDNSPFYVYGISYCDTFEAAHRDERLVFSKVTARGGHSTYRIKLPAGADHECFLMPWEGLARLGCTYEGSSTGTAKLYAIDMPPIVDVAAAYAYMDRKEREGVWFFEEGHYYRPEHGSSVQIS